MAKLMKTQHGIYAKPSDAAAAIKGYIAFWKGVDVR
jgi:uncharacterized protein (DUF427 family)